MRRRRVVVPIGAAALLLAGIGAILARPSGQTVTVVLKDGSERRARSVRTIPPNTLALTLEGGAEQMVSLSGVAAIRFHPPPAWRDKLAIIRRHPFVGPEFDRLLQRPNGKPLGAEERTRRAAALMERLEKEKNPERKMQQALNLAALRFSHDDLNGCREALRLVKTLAREAGDRRLHDEACVRLAALQLPDQKAADAELLGDIQDASQKADLKARIPVIERLAAQAAQP